MSFLRTCLVLSRAAGLPTVWSNCLAGWWLGGGRNPRNLLFLFLGATCLYLGGAFLNDVFDAEFDRKHRQSRPIPSGAVSWQSVWRWGVAWLALGMLLLLGSSITTAGLGLGLVVCIVLYNTVHKALVLAPLLLGLCRFFLYVIGSSAAVHGVSGWAIWCGLALAAYVAGLDYFHRWERTPALANYWPGLLLSVPILLALIMDADHFREAGLLLSAVLVLWVLRALRQTLWSAERNIRLTVSGLQAGIVFADWLACADAPRELSFLFLALFGATLLFQRFVPRV
jgi:4-hydroxybenzoate polyprenyltransferase